MSEKHRANFLTKSQEYDLHHAARMLSAAFGFHTYHVGSSLHKPDYHDVDLRCILDDEEYDKFIGDNKTKLGLLNRSISEWLAAQTRLPIDFQFQRNTEANKEFGGAAHVRNFVGIPLDRHGPAQEHTGPY